MMTFSQATPLQKSHRALLWLIRKAGWSIQGNLGAHFRPLLLVTNVPESHSAVIIQRIFLMTLPDSKRIVHLALKKPSSSDHLEKAWTSHRKDVSWVTCVGFDARKKCITVHRPFHPGPFPDREAHYLTRYLGYCYGEVTTPPPTPQALQAERDGY